MNVRKQEIKKGDQLVAFFFELTGPVTGSSQWLC
jgi:hypothetical protein